MNARMKVDAEVIGGSTDRACRVTGTPQVLRIRDSLANTIVGPFEGI